MGGAGLYLWLTLACVLFVLGLFALGWVLVRVGRRRGRPGPGGRARAPEGREP